MNSKEINHVRNVIQSVSATSVASAFDADLVKLRAKVP